MSSLSCSSHRFLGSGGPNVFAKQPPPPHDVPRHEEARADHLAAFDRVAHGEQRLEDPVAVAERRDAALEVQLRPLQRDLEALVLVAHVRLHVPAEGDVHVGVDEARRDELPGAVDPPGTVGDVDARTLPHRLDARAADEDRRVGEGWAAVAVDHRGPDDGDRAGGGLGARRLCGDEEKD